MTLNESNESGEAKYTQFKKDIHDEKTMSSKLENLYKNEYDLALSDILVLTEEAFLEQINNGVSLSLEDIYSDNCLSDSKLNKLMNSNINKIKNDYQKDSELINKAWNNHLKNSRGRNNDIEYLSNFRKHCIGTNQYAMHNCSKNNENCNFIMVKDSKENILFVICEKCKKVYHSDFIQCKCNKCNIDYFSSILSSDEDPNFLLATWENYHCPQLINEKMKCIKCKDYFYIDMKTGFLKCKNKKCEFGSKPTRILWTCNTCKTDFKCGAIPYNPLDIIVTKKVIEQTISLKHRAHPSKIECCKLNVFFINFYHKRNCKGILYEGELNNNIVIVCEKCHAINFYDRFIWTCPKCGKKFRDTKNQNDENNNEKNEKSEKNENNNEKNEKSEKNENNNEKNEKSENNNEKNSKKEETEKRYPISPIPHHKKFFQHKSLGEEKIGNILDTFDDKKNDERNDKTESSGSQGKKNNEYRRFGRRRMFNVRGFDAKEKSDEKEEKEEKEEERNVELSNDAPKKRSHTMHEKEFAFNNKNKVENSYNKDKHSQNNEIIEENEDEENKEKENEQENYPSRKRYHFKLNSKNKENDQNKKEDSLKPKETDTQNTSKEQHINSFRNKYRHKEEKVETTKNEKEKEEEKPKYLYSPSPKRRKYLSGLNIVSEKNKNIISFKGDSKKDLNKDIKKIINEEEDTNKNTIKDFESSEEEDSEDENNNNNNNNDMEFVKRRSDRRKTRGMEIEDDLKSNKLKEKQESKHQNNPLQNININNNSTPKNVPMSNIAGISEHLMNHINKRMNHILERCKIPLFNIEEYIITRKLGEGSYGIIFSVVKNDDKNKEYALKKIIARTLTEIDTYTKEFELVHSCNHPNIMKIYGICIRILDTTTYSLYVLMEISQSDWDREIKLRLLKKRFYTEEELINILRQLTNALLFMQKQVKISHRDIKPQNILIFPDNVYKLADFGEAKEVKISKQINTLRGTELYMSPALYDGLKHDKNDVSHDPFKSDVFSLGFCFLYAAALNFNLLYQVRDVSDGKTINNILNKTLGKNYSDKFIEIVSHMLELEESKRPSFTQLIDEIDKSYQESEKENNQEENKDDSHGGCGVMKNFRRNRK